MCWDFTHLAMCFIHQAGAFTEKWRLDLWHQTTESLSPVNGKTKERDTDHCCKVLCVTYCTPAVMCSPYRRYLRLFKTTDNWVTRPAYLLIQPGISSGAHTRGPYSHKCFGKVVRDHFTDAILMIYETDQICIGLGLLMNMSHRLPSQCFLLLLTFKLR